ncbi:hypothetical protein [Methylobacter sp.]|uniref:hypothetical protein n=1 Tax=Methylobacter sp. TaxID=2051955 RepID=UPI003DA56287
MIGKKVLNNVYWHINLTIAQPAEVQQCIVEAEVLAHVQTGIDYNVLKYDTSGFPGTMQTLFRVYPHDARRS